MAERVTTIEEAVVALLTGVADRDWRREAEREAHKLAGSMGTFGRRRGSDLAQEIERLLQGTEPLTPVATLRLSELAVDLRNELERDVDQAPEVTAPPVGDGSEILVVDADADFAHRVVEQALGRGLRATIADSPSGARAAATDRQPVLVLVDPAMAGPGAEGLGLVAELSAAVQTSPVLVVAAAAAGLDRVAVSRAGGHSLLQKPIAPSELMAAVARVLGRMRSDASVLVVDDDPTIAAFLAELLSTRGLHVDGVGDPRDVWAALDELRPDLLVLDLDMPDVDGLELCRLVRRDPVWGHLPIVFLTGTVEPEWVREMFSAGADDHIPKPIVADDVVARIANRLERSRALRPRDDRDPRSTLATADVFASEVDRLLALARRHDAPLALAVVEVDGLDGLKAAHGRAVAAKALAATGRLLSRSARPEDIVGWVSERRFGIAMYEQAMTSAVERVARFLEAVRDEGDEGGDRGPLPVTVSVGVSAFPHDGEAVASLLTTAGEALVRAQDGGGDRVVARQGAATGNAGVVDVLVVDDDEAMGSLLMHALSTRGYKCEWVQDGAEAATMLVDQQALGARVVLLDVGLPGLDGLSVLRTLGENGVLRSTRVIMLTLRSSDAEVVQALDLGAFDHVAKPFSLPVLLHRIRRALDSPPA